MLGRNLQNKPNGFCTCCLLRGGAEIGSFIGEVARSILDIIDYTKMSKMPGVLLFIDFKKAFDSIEWDFLYKSLAAFNFGPTLIG